MYPVFCELGGMLEAIAGRRLDEANVLGEWVSVRSQELLYEELGLLE